LGTLHPSRAIGCIVYPAAEVTAPGVIEHGYGDRFSLGEPDGAGATGPTRCRALVGGGFKAPVRPRIRDEMWVKLWGNLAFNPLSALTGATLDVITGEGRAARGVPAP
jgi:2-dehydropantoate 2-reductase